MSHTLSLSLQIYISLEIWTERVLGLFELISSIDVENPTFV